jgi:hypothetical protein
MKFWNRLRWLAAIVFVLFLAASWLATDPAATLDGSNEAPLRRAPNFAH